MEMKKRVKESRAAARGRHEAGDSTLRARLLIQPKKSFGIVRLELSYSVANRRRANNRDKGPRSSEHFELCGNLSRVSTAVANVRDIRRCENLVTSYGHRSASCRFFNGGHAVIIRRFVPMPKTRRYAKRTGDNIV